MKKTCIHILEFNSIVIVAILLSNFALSSCINEAGEINRYNILFISIDDLRPELGVYGNAYVNTPNIDRFGSEGVTFTHHYVQAVSCGPSRYALLTGRSPSNSGVSRNNNALFEGKTALKQQRTKGAQSMPELFRRSGYHTVGIGKISHTPDGRVFNYNGSGDGRHELPNAWDELPTPYGLWKRGWGAFFAYDNGRHREDGQGNRDLMEFVADGDEDLPDGMMASTAIDKLKELKNRNEPFFLGLGFFKPHLPFVATQKDWKAVQEWNVPPVSHPKRIYSPYWSKSGEFYRYDMPFPKTRPLAAENRMTVRRAYLASVRYIDRQVGRVLDALEELGLNDETIVILWSDHGWYLGEFEMWGKHTTFERASRSPLIIRTPDIQEPGRKSNALVQTIDLYPTLMDLTQPTFNETEHPLDGLSLAPILHNETEQLREGALTFWGNTVSVRTRDYRLFSTWGDSAWTNSELYDMRKGLDASVNIAGSHPEIVTQLKKLLKHKSIK